jgi:hypothetical protein
MRALLGLRFFAVGVFLLGVALLLTRGAWAGCPNTLTNLGKCPEPFTTVDCLSLSETVCNANKGQTKFPENWTCKFQNECGKQCLDGVDEVNCWIETQCLWVPSERKCKIDPATMIIHKAVPKVETSC